MPKKKMKQWRVRHTFHSVVTNDEIEAETEEEAIQISREQLNGNMIGLNAETYDEVATEVR